MSQYLEHNGHKKTELFSKVIFFLLTTLYALKSISNSYQNLNTNNL